MSEPIQDLGGDRVSAYTPTTEQVRTEWVESTRSESATVKLHAGAAFDRWLAQHDTELLASIIPEEIRTYWEWTEQRRARFKDRDCTCGACQMMANIARITRPPEAEQ